MKGNTVSIHLIQERTLRSRHMHTRTRMLDAQFEETSTLGRAREY